MQRLRATRAVFCAEMQPRGTARHRVAHELEPLLEERSEAPPETLIWLGLRGAASLDTPSRCWRAGSLRLVILSCRYACRAGMVPQLPVVTARLRDSYSALT